MSKTAMYLRIGTTYFKKSNFPTLTGDKIETLIPWSPELIRQDHGKDALSKIEKFDGFICYPENRPEHYLKMVEGYYNTYHQMSKKPVPGEIKNTMVFLKHIFGEQLELGIDYLQILYLKPLQILPILCLVSKERATGKSTFLKWMKEIFELNLTYITNDSFSSNFNADWASKLLICVDEVLFQTEQLTERIKYLSTTNVNKIEAKGKDRREIEFFGKFILCSNNETSFIKIDPDEIRFWVRKINPYEKEDVYFLSKLLSEIPHFLNFLANRKLSTENSSRMWFTREQIKTDALTNLIRHNCNKLETELCNMLINIIEVLNVEVLDFTLSDLQNALNKFRIKYDATEIRRIIRKKWCLQQQENPNKYEKVFVTQDLDIGFNPSKGRFYSISRQFLLEKV
ncbi:primase-helicase family protein [Flavobacterium facile]|jgi:hypothetical protein|uniref:primase-helicase family protein n=1 Tax=Flavobacterium facile TaxID=2893174 RepID=UPI002E79548D|nr:primase-helicase family protein [Flavobacterium sp. T-12]